MSKRGVLSPAAAAADREADGPRPMIERRRFLNRSKFGNVAMQPAGLKGEGTQPPETTASEQQPARVATIEPGRSRLP